MISRKKIISRSQSDLDYSSKYNDYEIEEDLWYNSDKLYQDHITEILRKWDQIDDEIWGKIICMERNRRIAKAYSRVPVLSITGAEDGFDGYKIGLNGFDNPMRDALTKTVKRHIGKGVRLKMDDLGNIIIKRMSNCDVFIRGWDKESNSLSDEIVELSGELEYDRSVKLFDMKKFQASINRELRSAYPDRRKLENQCICAIAFVKDAADVLDLCSWVMLINIVALDMIKSRFPTMNYQRVPQQREPRGTDIMTKAPQPKFVSIFEQQQHQQQQLLHRSSSDEDPYSLPSIPSMSPGVMMEPGLGSRGGGGGVGDKHITVASVSKSDQKPPELPPRDFVKSGKKSKNKNFQALKSLVGKSGSKTQQPKQTSSQLQKDAVDKKKEIEYEDPYYCGLQARVPNFGGGGGGRQRKSIALPTAGVVSSNGGHYGQTQQQHHHQQQQMQHQDMRKAQSSGYLNSLFNQSSSFHPKAMHRGSSHYSYYDSSLESDAYGISSGSGYDIYAPLNGPLYGRVRAQLAYDVSVPPRGAPTRSGNSNNNGNNRNASSKQQQQQQQVVPFSYTARYATEWD